MQYGFITLAAAIPETAVADMQTVTLPGYADMIDGVSYYILDPAGVADVINQSCNPYTREINANDLNIVY